MGSSPTLILALRSSKTSASIHEHFTNTKLCHTLKSFKIIVVQMNVVESFVFPPLNLALLQLSTAEYQYQLPAYDLIEGLFADYEGG